MATSTKLFQRIGGQCLRAAVPCAILAAGWLGYSKLAVEVEKEAPPEAEKQVLRTRVEELEVIDYPVIIQTHAVVQAHNQVTLAAQISGVITKVSPSFEAGAYFSEGEVLVEIDDRNYLSAVAMADSRLLAAKSALRLAKLNEERKLRLVESNAVSQAEVDAASATREQAEADLASAEAQLHQAKLDLKRTKVVASFDGRVQTKMIGLGQMAGPNTPLGEIFAVDFAEVRLPISGRQRQFLRLPEFADDPPVDVVLKDAITESPDAVWRARIVRTEGVLDPNSRDLFAIARIDDPFGRKSGCPPLRIGQPVVASIDGQVLQDVVALPRGAVRQLDKIVLVNRNDQTLLPITIESIWSNAEHVVVDGSAIPEGMWLATTPMVITPQGAKVEIIPDVSPTASIADSTPADASGPAAQ